MTGQPLRIAIFCGDLSAPGGAERLVFEEAEGLRRLGHEVVVITFAFSPTVTFSGRYAADVQVLEVPSRGPRAFRFTDAVRAIHRFLRAWQPSIVVATSPNDCARLVLPASLARVPYITHVNGTQFWFPPEQDLTKYSWRYRGVLEKVFEVSPSHEEFVPRQPPRISAAKRLRLESSALLHWMAVRHARRRLTFSRRMAWEVELLYRRPADTLKGAFPRSIFSYTAAGDPTEAFRVADGPVILNVNRLEPRKRVGLVIDSFERVATFVSDSVLLIGGTGPSEDELRSLVADRGLGDRVHFLGFVAESELWDWLAGCDVFIHPNWAEFAIAPFEAMALGASVVWADEMELDPEVERLGQVFPAAPNADAMAAAMVAAIGSPRKDRPAEQLDPMTWERYVEALAEILEDEAR